jgi:hypothetical protein
MRPISPIFSPRKLWRCCGTATQPLHSATWEGEGEAQNTEWWMWGQLQRRPESHTIILVEHGMPKKLTILRNCKDYLGRLLMFRAGPRLTRRGIDSTLCRLRLLEEQKHQRRPSSM